LSNVQRHALEDWLSLGTHLFVKIPRPGDILKYRIFAIASPLCINQGRNQDFAEGGVGLKMKNFCDVILMT